MGERLRSLVAAAAFILAVFVLTCAPGLQAQAPTLQEQLAAQYKVAKIGSDTSGYSVVEAGTLLAIQKGGILAVPYGDSGVLASKYEGGSVHGPSGMSLLGRKSVMGRFGKELTTHLFAVGDKVYPTKIDVNPTKDTVTMSIVACDSCNKTDPPTYNKALVIFQFPRGSIAKAGAGEVEDVIGQLLSVSDSQDEGGGNDQQGGNDQGGGNNGNAGGNGGGGQDQQQQQAEPQTIEKGMTTDQVQQALGKPEKIVNLGAKQLYIYKDMKVTFIGGKVVDVQ